MQRGDDLERFAREHHVHYDVQPGFGGAGEERELVEFDLRLFASHPGKRLAVPGCERCAALAGELASFARQLVSDGEIAGRADVLPAEPVLYESPDEHDTDEVALTVRVRCESPEHRNPRDGEACTRELLDRLAAVGVQRS